MSDPCVADPRPRPPDCNAALVLADGTAFWGRGVGMPGQAVGEVCFNTSITGYQEILTDPSYAGQIITFTFPHIGNVGANHEDIETITPAARGLVVRTAITDPSNYRATQSLDSWLRGHGIVGLSGVDTRRLTRHIRDKGAPSGVIAYRPDGILDIDQLREEAVAWPGLEGMDLAKEVTCHQSYEWTETIWRRERGYGRQEMPRFHVVAIDYGAKYNILRMLAERGCRVTVVPATASAEDILRHEPDGIFLSNGPGDPAATGDYAVPVLRDLIASGKPIFGICLGHQLMALALGGITRKMAQGHRGANHPVRDRATGKVEITSQNHGFVVDPDSLPAGVEPTHVSLFDHTNEGLQITGLPVFSVQHHPEASPGPQDSHYLFERFIGTMEAANRAGNGVAQSVLPTSRRRGSEMNEDRFIEAYLQMARVAKYRPAAPGDGLGNINLSEEELEVEQILEDEAAQYAAQFKQEEDELRFSIGCSMWETNRALVYIIEAARSICGGADAVALKLLRMAINDIQEAKRRKTSA